MCSTTTEVTVSTPDLAMTGERTVPGIPAENYWFRRHEVVYAAIPGWVGSPPGRVLDAGSGEGYGVAQLGAAWPGARVLGIDYDGASLAHARERYGSARAAFVRGPLTSAPLPDNSFDVIVSLQVIEHIWTPGAYLRELTRVGRPGATVVLSTPNRLTFSPGVGRREKPANLFHAREYDALELAALVGETVEVTTVLGVHHAARLTEWARRHGDPVRAQLQAPAEAWPGALREMVASVTTADFDLSPAGPDASLDLVVVGRVS